MDVFIAGQALCLRNIISRTNEIWRGTDHISYRTESLSEDLCAVAVWRPVGGQRQRIPRSTTSFVSVLSLPDDEPPTPTTQSPRARAILTTTVSNCSHSFTSFLNTPVAICVTTRPLNLQATDEIDKT